MRYHKVKKVIDQCKKSTSVSSSDSLRSRLLLKLKANLEREEL